MAASAFLGIQQANRVWELYRRALLRPTHCFILVACAVALLRKELLVAPMIVPHLLGFVCTFSASSSSRQIAAYASLATTVYAIAVGSKAADVA
jgi:hypothetical protein